MFRRGFICLFLCVLLSGCTVSSEKESEKVTATEEAAELQSKDTAELQSKDAAELQTEEEAAAAVEKVNESAAGETGNERGYSGQPFFRSDLYGLWWGINPDIFKSLLFFDENHVGFIIEPVRESGFYAHGSFDMEGDTVVLNLHGNDGEDYYFRLGVTGISDETLEMNFEGVHYTLKRQMPMDRKTMTGVWYREEEPWVELLLNEDGAGSYGEAIFNWSCFNDIVFIYGFEDESDEYIGVYDADQDTLIIDETRFLRDKE